MFRDNKYLGEFNLDGIPPAPRGIPQVEVTFDIDANGILHVKAKDKGTGKEQSIRIEGSSGLTKEEKERMMKEAEAHAAEDAKKKEEVDSRNAAETLVWTTEKMVADNKDKVKEEDKKDLEAKITELKTALAGTDMEKIKSAGDALGQAAQKVGASLYQQNPQQPGAQQAQEVKPEEKQEDKTGETTT
jgi:molecular chaperone DnaK